MVHVDVIHVAVVIHAAVLHVDVIHVDVIHVAVVVHVDVIHVGMIHVAVVIHADVIHVAVANVVLSVRPLLSCRSRSNARFGSPRPKSNWPRGGSGAQGPCKGQLGSYTRWQPSTSGHNSATPFWSIGISACSFLQSCNVLSSPSSAANVLPWVFFLFKHALW